MGGRARGVLLAAIAIAWLSSLALPAVHLPSGTAYGGFELLRRAWAAPQAGIFAWYANPLFIGAALLGVLGWMRTAGVLASVALFLGLTSFAAEPLARASGAAVPPLTWGIGFYLWLASLAALCVSMWVFVARQHFGGISMQTRD